MCSHSLIEWLCEDSFFTLQPLCFCSRAHLLLLYLTERCEVRLFLVKTALVELLRDTTYERNALSIEVMGDQQ